MAVSDDQITAHLPAIKSVARQFSGRWGAEMDDLIQEGMIAVWLSLEGKIDPTSTYIGFRMKNWTRLCQKEWTFERVWEIGLHPEGS